MKLNYDTTAAEVDSGAVCELPVAVDRHTYVLGRATNSGVRGVAARGSVRTASDSRNARARCSTRTTRASSTATSSRRTSW